MIPYPGESLTVRAAIDVGGIGSGLLDAIRYRDGSATLGAASEWTAWVSAGWPDYLEDDTVSLDVAWVVEVLSGSVTVDVSEGVTTSRGGTNPTPISLGTHTLTVGTNVIPSTFTATDVLFATNNMMVRIEGVSGSAVVQQVKLRAWPTTGVEGGWTDPFPEFTRHVNADAYLSGSRDIDELRAGAPGTSGDLWDEVKAAVQGHAGETTSSPLTPGAIVRGGATATTRAEDLDVLGASAHWTVTTGATVAQRPESIDAVIDDTLPLEEGVDYIRPPDEVFGDNAHHLRPLGSVGISWDSGTATMQVDHGDDEGGQMFVAVTPYTGDLGTLTLAWPDGSASVAGGTLSLPDSPLVLIASTHSWVLDDLDLRLGEFTDAWQFVVGNGLYDFTAPSGDGFVGLQYVAAYPRYQLWSPTFTVTRVIPLRQFHRDDGLGVTPPRAFGGASRIRTGRAYGYD